MDGGDPIEADEADLLSDTALAELRAHPKFREAVEAFAAAALTEYENQDSVTRWLNRDLGRASLYLAALLLDGASEGLTFARLAQAAEASGTCSRGRVLAFIHYALANGRLTLEPPGPQPWARRRLSLTAEFVRPVRSHLGRTLAATSIVAPEVEAALPRLGSDTVVSRMTAALTIMFQTRPELRRNPGGPLREIFVSRDAGMRVLQHLMVSQPAERERLMQTAPLSRANISRRYNVSRTHVNRILTEAEAAGALRLFAGDQVTFSPAFSEEVEAYYAGMIQVNRAIAALALASA
jgi:hypothetical protein